MSETDAEVVIVGAGPAGSAATITLARAGRSVLLVDRSSFPRDKPCGDLIGARAIVAARTLGIAESVLAPYPKLVDAYLTASERSLDLVPAGRLGRATLPGSDARVIPRLVFDNALVETALEAGAAFRQMTVRHVSVWQNGCRIVTGTDPDGPVTIKTRAVIVSGGYGCRIAADLDRESELRDPRIGIAMRGYFSGVASPPARIAFSLDDWVLPGYGWVFPLPDGRANVGVGMLTESGERRERLQELFQRFTSDPASPAATWLCDARLDERPRSWPLDLGPRKRQLLADGLLVAGESAALVGPLTGAGIAFALESGAEAGRVLAGALGRRQVSADFLGCYQRTIRRRYGLWLRAESVAQRWLTNPRHVRSLLRVVKPFPPTGALGARLLLHLG